MNEVKEEPVISKAPEPLLSEVERQRMYRDSQVMQAKRMAAVGERTFQFRIQELHPDPMDEASNMMRFRRGEQRVQIVVDPAFNDVLVRGGKDNALLYIRDQLRTALKEVESQIDERRLSDAVCDDIKALGIALPMSDPDYLLRYAQYILDDHSKSYIGMPVRELMEVMIKLLKNSPSI